MSAARSTAGVAGAISPLMSTTSVLLDAVGVFRGTPFAWLSGVRESLDGVHLAALRPMFSEAAPRRLPDCLLPRPAAGDNTFADEVARVADLHPDVLVGDLYDDGLLDSPWSLAARHPRRWRDVYCSALGRTWSVLSQVWPAARSEFESEFADGPTTRRAAQQRCAPLARPALNALPLGPGCTLVPLLGGTRAGFVQVTGDEVVYVAYPSAATSRLANGGTLPDHHSGLSELLRGPRSEILQRAAGATPAGDLASVVKLAPNALAYHLAILERAGLVVRERSGRNVLVRRTERAEALIQIFAAADP